MAYQLDYKKVYNTFGPKNKRERYGTEIGKQVNNLMASFNTQLPARYGLFLNKDYNPEIYTPGSSEVYPGNGTRIFWPEKENTWYYVRQDVAWNDNFCTGKILYGYNETNDVLEPISSHSSNPALNKILYGRTSNEPLKSFIHIPVKPGKTYCLQFINNNNIIMPEASYNYPDLYLFAEGVRDDGKKCIFAYFEIGNEKWHGWHKHITSDKTNFHCFLQMPEEYVLSVLKEPLSGTQANDYIKITNYILGVLYPYSYNGIDSKTEEIIPYDYEIQGFLWESDRPALVNQNGIVTEYINSEWEEWEGALTNNLLLSVDSTEDVADILTHPYSKASPIARRWTDARPELIETESMSYSVKVPPQSISVTSPLRQLSFRNWLWINKKDLIVVPLKLHMESYLMPRRMLNEKGKKTYSTTKIRPWIIGQPGGKKWPAYVGKWENDDWVFPDIQFSDLNDFVDFLGVDGYNENNEPYSIIGFCFSVRNKHHNNQLNIPGGLYAEYIPSSMKKNEYSPYIIPKKLIHGQDTVTISTRKSIAGNQYIQEIKYKNGTTIPIPIGYQASPVISAKPLVQISFTPSVPNGWQLDNVNFDAENIVGKFKDPDVDLMMKTGSPTYSEDGKTIYIAMRTGIYPEEWKAKTRNWEITIPYTATYKKSI